jgi:hypothetical protein
MALRNPERRAAAQAAGKEAAEASRKRRAWAKAIETNLSFLERLTAEVEFQDPKWVEKMRAHHGKRIDDLMKVTPPGCDRAVTAFRRRIAKV